MAGIRDDSAGDYGQWLNPQDQSWLDYLGMKAADVGDGAYNALANITGSLTPIGTSPEGNMALQVPPMFSGLYDSAKRIGERGGFTRVEEFDAPLKQDLANALLTFYGGNALTGLTKPRGALGAGAMREAEAQPIRAYRGATNAGNIARDDASILWGSSSPDVASTYARPHFTNYDIEGAVAPLDIDFKNPMTVNANGQHWADLEHGGQRYTADDLANFAKSQGHDGLVVKNVVDTKSWYPGEPRSMPADTYVALQRGTVKSPLTGETLFSDNQPSILGAALATAGEQPRVSVSGQHPNYQIMNDGSQVGRAYVREYPETIQLGQLHVDPEFQRQGIATEAQRLLARQYGKPTVPDVNLSQAELARWQKNDPAAVADYVPYFEGASSFMPAQGTDAYWASQGSGVVPGTRASRGELFSRGVPLPPQQDDNLPDWLKF